MELKEGELPLGYIDKATGIDIVEMLLQYTRPTVEVSILRAKALKKLDSIERKLATKKRDNKANKKSKGRRRSQAQQKGW